VSIGAGGVKGEEEEDERLPEHVRGVRSDVLGFADESFVRAGGGAVI
jgi:hypothetical protein